MLQFEVSTAFPFHSRTLVLLSGPTSNLFNRLRVFRSRSWETPGLTYYDRKRHWGTARNTKGLLRSSTCDWKEEAGLGRRTLKPRCRLTAQTEGLEQRSLITKGPWVKVARPSVPPFAQPFLGKHPKMSVISVQKQRWTLKEFPHWTGAVS